MWPVLGKGLQGVQGPETDRGLLVTELLHRLRVQLSLVGSVLLGLSTLLFGQSLLVAALLVALVLAVRPVRDDQAASHGKPGQSLDQRGPDVIPGFQLLFDGEAVLRVPGEQPRTYPQREHDKGDRSEARQGPDNDHADTGTSPLGHSSPEPACGSVGGVVRVWPGAAVSSVRGLPPPA
jgi:hypothetical protein